MIPPLQGLSQTALNVTQAPCFDSLCSVVRSRLTSGIQSNLTVPDIGNVEQTQPEMGPEAETGLLQISEA